MSISISLGWWLLPLGLTLVCFFIAHRMMPEDTRYSNAPWGNAVVGIILYGIATLVSAAIWIVYLIWVVYTK